MRRFACVAVVVLSVVALSGQGRAARTLNIYVIDVEGGNATLFVSPTGESLLIDTGNAGAGAVRDATRIMEAARDAGLSKIDHVIITHWHGDHYGGLAELAARIPISHFIGLAAPAPDSGEASTWPADVTMRASKPSCASFRPGTNNAEDPQSVGSVITFGRFRAVHFGDLTKNKEFELMCPANRIGTVDVLLGLHHGQDTSNSEVMVHALRPRVAIMNNGTRKGGLPEVMQTVYTSPRFEDLWQIHFSVLSGQEYTTPGLFIANGIDDQPSTMPIAPVPLPPPGPNTQPAPVHDGPAHWIKVAAQEDGAFTVTNARNGFSKSYAVTPK